MSQCWSPRFIPALTVHRVEVCRLITLSWTLRHPVHIFNLEASSPFVSVATGILTLGYLTCAGWVETLIDLPSDLHPRVTIDQSEVSIHWHRLDTSVLHTHFSMYGRGKLWNSQSKLNAWTEAKK